MPKSPPNPRVQLTRSVAAERASARLQLKMSTSSPPRGQSAVSAEVEHCFICGDDNIATHRQAQSLYQKQTAVFKKFLLAPDFLCTLNLQPHLVAEMKSNRENSACAPCLTFIKEVWDYHQQIEALQQDIKNVMEKTRTSLLLRKCSTTTEPGFHFEIGKTSPPPSPSSVAVSPMPDFDNDNEDMEVDECYNGDDGDGFVLSDGSVIHDVLETSMEMAEINRDDGRPRKTRQTKIKAMQIVKKLVAQESPKKGKKIKTELDSENDNDFEENSEKDSDSDSEHEEIKVKSGPQEKRRKTNNECPSCRKVLSHRRNLLIHQVAVCGLEVPKKELDDYHIKFKQCEQCTKIFAKSSDYQKHLRTHSTAKGTSDKAFPCDKCDKSFNQKASLVAHQTGNCSGNENIDDVKCPKCGKILSTQKHLLVHKVLICGLPVDDKELKKYRIKIHQCPHCPKQFARANDLNKHTVTHTGAKPFTCSRCGKSFSRKTSALAHEKVVCTATPEEAEYRDRFKQQKKLTKNRLKKTKPFGCRCKRRFNTDQELAVHQVANNCKMGGENSIVICDLCGLSVQRYSLQIHHRRVHNQERPFLCPYDGKSFFDTKSLKRHQQTVHENPKDPNNFACPQCKRRFTTRKECEEHKNADSCDVLVPDTVVCDLCGKSLSANTLKSHLRRVHRPKSLMSFTCPLQNCEDAFYDRRQLERHLNKHKKEGDKRSFTCRKCREVFTKKEDKDQHECVMCTYAGCDKGFKSTTLRNRHVQKVHEKEEEEDAPKKKRKRTYLCR